MGEVRDLVATGRSAGGTTGARHVPSGTAGVRKVEPVAAAKASM